MFTFALVTLAEEISTVTQEQATQVSASAFSLNWPEIINASIGTFIGIITAIISSYLYDRLKNRRETKELILSIKKELEGIIQEIEKVESYMDEEKQRKDRVLLLNPLKSYIWDSVVSSDKISLIAEKSWYNKLLSIYHTVKEYNTWELMRTNKILEGADVSYIDESLRDVGCSLADDIQKILIDIGK